MNFKTLSATALMTGLVTMGAFAQNAMPVKSTASAPAPAMAQTATNDKAVVNKPAAGKAPTASAPVVQPTLEELKANTEKAKKQLADAEAAKKAKPAASAK
jgi:hypothetical protein